MHTINIINIKRESESISTAICPSDGVGLKGSQRQAEKIEVGFSFVTHTHTHNEFSLGGPLIIKWAHNDALRLATATAAKQNDLDNGKGAGGGAAAAPHS